MNLRPLRDRIKPGVRVLFVGINPGIRSSQTGHHFAGFSNRFWRLLFESGLVPEPITFQDDDRLPEFGFGITNIVPRPTPGIDTIRPAEYPPGRARLRRKILRHRPPIVALIGVTVFRAMFPERKDAVTLGLQAEQIGKSAVFVLPNPSGRNANFSYAEMLAAFRALRRVRLPLLLAALLVAALSTAAGAQTIVHSFDGDKGPDVEHCDPGVMRCGRQPEPNVAANGTQVVQVTWQHFNVYSYSGTVQASTPMAEFIRAAGLDPMPPVVRGTNHGPFEPHVVFDELIGRWVVTVTCVNDCLLVSATADPLGEWHGVYLGCLQGGPCLNGDPGLHIGYDKNGLYYCGAHVGDEHPQTVPKVAYDCLAVSSDEVKSIGSGQEPRHINRAHNLPLDILPAVDHNPNKAPHAPALFAAKSCNRAIQGGCQYSENFSFSWLIDTFTWNGPTGTYNTAGEQTVPTDVGSKHNKWLYNLPCCGALATMAQKGSEIGLRAAESHRLINLVQHGSHAYGVLGSGPCTHDCGAQGTDTNNVMFYVDFDCTKPSACIVAQTTKISSAEANPVYGTVGVDQDGNVGITAISSTAVTNMSVLMWTRLKSDPPNTFKGPMTVVAGTQPYTCPNPSAAPAARGMVPIANAVGILTLRDPLDGTKLWTVQQYAADRTPCVWNTRIIEYGIKK